MREAASTRRGPVNVTCPQCSAPYFVDEQKIPDRGGRLSCPGCDTRWTIYRPGTGELHAVGAPAVLAAEPPPIAGATPGGTPITRQRPASVDPDVTCPRCGHSFIPTQAARPLPQGPAGRRVVLLVEDQKYFTELASEALGRDYRTISVATKDEALRVIDSEKPSVMILDLNLARGQDGRDLLRSLPGKSFPILIFTARDETEMYGPPWEELKALGADDIVHKGMNVGDELRRKVSWLLDRKPPAR